MNLFHMQRSLVFRQVFGALVLLAACFCFQPAASAQLTVTLSTTEPDPTNVSPFRVRAVFSNPVSDFDQSDVTVTNATVSNFSGGGPNYNIFVTPAADGLITVDIPAGAAHNRSGTPNQAASQFTIVYDGTPPVVSSILASDPNPTNASTVNFTLQFSEPVTGVDLADVSLVTTGAITGATIDSVIGSGSTYVATVSGLTQEGTVQLLLADDDSILDAATNVLGGVGVGNGDFNTGDIYTIDLVPPTIAVGGPSVPLTNVGPVTYTVSYTGADAITLAPGDVTLNTTGDATGNVSVTGGGTASRTVTIDTITGNGSLGITIAAGTASDAAGNTAAGAGPSTTFAVDNTAPTISIGAPSVALTMGGPVTFMVTYTGADAVTLVPGDITLDTTGDATGNISVTGAGTASRTVTIDTITGDGTLGITIAAGTASDMAGNTAAGAGPSMTFAVDNTAPTISIGAPSVALTMGGPVTFMVTYTGADAVTLVPGDITLDTTGDATGNISVTGAGTASRTVTIDTITGDGTLGITIAPGTASDTAGNGAAGAGPSTTFTVDNTAPTIAIGAPSVALTMDGPVSFTVTYTGADAVTLAPGDVTLDTTGDATGNVSVTGAGTASRTVTIDTITGDGTIGITIAAGTASDTAGNSAAGAGPSTTFTVDNTAPTIAIGAPSVALTMGGPVTFTVTYTGADAVSLAPGDVTLDTTGDATGNVSVTGAGTASRTVTIDAIMGDGTIGITIAGGTGSDTAGNSAAGAGPSTTFAVDNTAPTVSIGAPSAALTMGGPVMYTVTYTGAAAVTLAPGDVTLNTTGDATGNISVTGAGTASRTVTIDTITGDGSIGITIAAGTASDTAGNSAAGAGPSTTFAVDNTAPTIANGSPSVPLTQGGPVTFTVTYTDADAVTLGAGDVSLDPTGDATGNVSVTGAGTATRMVTIDTITGDGTLGITIAADTASDAAGNSAAGTGPSTTFVVDNTAPSISVDTLTTNDSSPPLTGSVNDPLAAISVTVSGQTIGGVNVGDGTWMLPNNTLMILDPGPHDVQVTATDGAGNIGSDGTTDELLIAASGGGGIIVSNLAPEDTFEEVHLILTATAGGTNYQWFKDGAPLTDDARIQGTNTQALIIQPAELGDSGTYTTQYENGVAKTFVETDPFPLVVLPLPPPMSAGRPLTWIVLVGVIIACAARYRARIPQGRN